MKRLNRIASFASMGALIASGVLISGCGGDPTFGDADWVPSSLAAVTVTATFTDSKGKPIKSGAVIFHVTIQTHNTPLQLDSLPELQNSYTIASGKVVATVKTPGATLDPADFVTTICQADIIDANGVETDGVDGTNCNPNYDAGSRMAAVYPNFQIPATAASPDDPSGEPGGIPSAIKPIINGMKSHRALPGDGAAYDEKRKDSVRPDNLEVKDPAKAFSAGRA